MRLRSRWPWRPAAMAAAVVTLIAGATAACGSDTGDQAAATQAADAAKGRLAGNPALAELVAAAKKEGALNLNWGFDGRDTGKVLTDTFKRAYGLDIKITLTPNQNQPGNAAKLSQEYKAKSPASTDAYLGSPELVLGLGPERDGVLEKVDWTKFAPWTKGLASKNGAALTFADLIPGFTYNTTQIDKVPTTAEDVLKLGKPIASTPYAAQFNVLGTKDVMGTDRLRTYIKGFKAAGFLGCGELNRIASGEFAAMWISCGKNIGDVFAAQGAPLKTAVLKDAAITSTRYVAVPKNAQHPNAAKLWVTWLLTPEAQKLVFKHDFTDNSRIPGSQTAKQLAEYQGQGVKFTRVDYEFTLSHPEIYNPKFKGELIKLLTTT
ncbi:ABC transporter substrate-binding protein [Actinomadura barringtoniae]|uniref:ABC transporter substrate-binding protein n=1 Tax=Actinomadura barringtoniae TaxID=1427535 RepID=A0A939TD70_9ACTN|nr:extracellular solute-binding protein [Actinomadura barringtoniae]MBO2455287.1 ABC transporter substrate-binding protein [Actinomadura barringtoniae]